MDIIVVSKNRGRLCSLGLCHPVHYIISFSLVIGLLTGAGLIGYLVADKSQLSPVEQVSEWKVKIHNQHQELEQLKAESTASLESLTSRLGMLQAHVNRIDALGQKLISMAKIDKGEFDFSQAPALGGPVTQQDTDDLTEEEMVSALDQLSLSLEDRENQLQVLEDLLLSRNILEEVQPSGRPILKGWLSSYYGMRNHPISGKREMHKGVDFAGKLGDPVVSVAKGIVTFSGKKYGYGQVVDINHGNGYVTRYAHNSKILVSVGDTVEKGFQIAELGTSGRSTGPHVHFEVIKNGKQINPMKFIRASR